jgi:hypothetical protein
MRLERRLRHAAPPDAAGAHERARRVVLSAAPAVERRRRRAPALVLLALLVTGLALTPPGDALAQWLRDLVAPRHHVPAVATHFGRLPAGGRVLAVGASGAYVIADDQHRRRLGAYTDAEWSPHGIYVAVTRDRVLRAVEPGGRTHWTLTAAGTVSAPRWSGTGFRIAYRRDDDLRIVAGDGSGDHPLVDSVADVPAAWRPGAANDVAVARRDGRVELWNADTGLRAWSRRAEGVSDLGWTPGGRLVVAADRELLVLAGSGRVLARRPLASGVMSAALAPDGTRVALARARSVSTLQLRGTREQQRLTLDRVDSVAWGPDGRTLLVTAPGRWYFLPARGGPVRAAPVRGLSRVTGWCC